MSRLRRAVVLGEPVALQNRRVTNLSNHTVRALRSFETNLLGGQEIADPITCLNHSLQNGQADPTLLSLARTYFTHSANTRGLVLVGDSSFEPGVNRVLAETPRALLAAAHSALRWPGKAPATPKSFRLEH